jgi:hypothetical protein
MQIKGLGFWGVMSIVALVGCGSSGGAGGTGGSTGTGGGTSAGTGGGTGSGKGGTTGGGGAFTTSLPAGTKVTSLTTAQATQLCNDLESYVNNNLFPSICKEASALSGPEAAYFDLLENPSATDADLRAACVSAAAMDAGNPCTDIQLDGGTETCDISQIPATCQATVGDYTTCINDMATADNQLYASVPSCSTLTAASVTAYFAADGGASAEPPEPASCSKFDSTCDVDGGTPLMSNMKTRMMPKRRR